MMTMRDEDAIDGLDALCAGCGGRREFLRDAAAIAAALMVSLGARGAGAQPMAPRPVRALAARAGEATYPIPAADGATIDREREVIIARWAGRVYAFALSCPHQRTMLRWQEGEHRFQCPKHHSRYTPEGAFISGRATRGMDRHPVRREGATVVVSLDTLHRQDRDPAGWNAASVAV
ncbi:MAG TPA: Rieske (2Fe-2S) protein [Longimicrobium sp.]|nr:Rieske (2Fe-2S) protein [Longimicrobium sp.]